MTVSSAAPTAPMGTSPPPAGADGGAGGGGGVGAGARGGDRRPRRPAPRTAFLLRRLGRLVVSLVVVVLATFAIVHLVPGDPVRAALGNSATPELVASTRAELGLDRPLGEQLTAYVGGLATGDLGQSVRSKRDVATTIGQRFPITLALAVQAFVLAVLGAVPLGLASAASARSGRHRFADGVLSGVLGVLIAVPNFLLAVGLVALFAVGLGWLPVAGWGSTEQVVLPVLALALGPMAYLARIVHVEMTAVLGATYLTTARAKRLPAHLVHLRHALPNIVTSTLTVGGLLLSGLTAATVLIEAVFAIPGLGQTTVAAVTAKDYPLVQGVVLVYALIVLGVNLVVDLVLVTVDPRSSIAEG